MVEVDRAAQVVMLNGTRFHVRRLDGETYEIARDGHIVGVVHDDNHTRHVIHAHDATVADMRAIYAVARAWFTESQSRIPAAARDRAS